jgi:hypothetical protein
MIKIVLILLQDRDIFKNTNVCTRTKRSEISEICKFVTPRFGGKKQEKLSSSMTYTPSWETELTAASQMDVAPDITIVASNLPEDEFEAHDIMMCFKQEKYGSVELLLHCFVKWLRIMCSLSPALAVAKETDHTTAESFDSFENERFGRCQSAAITAVKTTNRNPYEIEYTERFLAADLIRRVKLLQQDLKPRKSEEELLWTQLQPSWWKP